MTKMFIPVIMICRPEMLIWITYPLLCFCLLNQVFKQSLKTASIGQATMQAARPRDLIVPLQLGLGIQMHHQFSSIFLVDSLNHHGFSSSYTEVQQYERSAAVHQGMEIGDYTSDQISLPR